MFAPQPAMSSSSSGDSPLKRGTSRRTVSIVVHGQLSSLVRMAVSSSVTSMPTGHQVMQRPQPTQPDVPNWSCQVPNLWVSHWR